MGEDIVASMLGRTNANTSHEDLFRKAMEVCPVGIVMIDAFGEIMLANSEFEQMFGVTKDELLGSNIDALMPKDQIAGHRFKAAMPAASRASKTCGVAGRRKDGSEIQLEIRLQPVSAAHGVFMVGAVTDISDRTRALSLKDEFIATVSHELRTPVTSIIGTLDLLTADASRTFRDDEARLIVIAQKNARRLVQLVNSILLMQKIQSGRVMFARRPVEVLSLLAETIEINQPSADAYGVRIRLDDASTTAETSADPEWLTQVVTNLLSNAVKFSPAGEEVVVTTSQCDGKVLISVRDHGCGIQEEFKPHVFEKFAQADATNTRERGGTGLGLSIVKEMVTRLGGEVTFDDAPGGGAIFHVTLPTFQVGAGHHAATDYAVMAR